ncbi:endonuclease domain-containing protein [Pseudomonadales bacterium]|nr:endonuclease domain-containing protein [Pseudomonadales bacterium]
MVEEKGKANKVGILPRNFQDLLGFFYDSEFEAEVKFGRFRVDFYSENMKLAFEYDGIQHYSVIQKIESDKRKNALLESEGIKLVRWPYYYMPTMDTCKYIFQDHYSEQKFSSMLQSMFAARIQNEISAPGFHSTPNIPANFIWAGIDKFLKELEAGPPSILHQVRHSLKLYCDVKAEGNKEIVIPTHHEKFMKFFNGENDIVNLDVVFKNGPTII